MGRSVAIPGNAVATVFIDVSEYDSDTWRDFVDDLREVIRERYPSFSDCARWVGRETQAILENNGAIVVLSEYGGLAAVSIGSHDAPGLVRAWCHRIAGHWQAHLEKRYSQTALRHVATASNGEAFFRKAV